MSFAAVEVMMAEAVATQAAPAIALEVGDTGGIRWQQTAGALTYAPGAPPTSRQTVFDLASLTKVIATTSLVMQLVQRGRMQIDWPVSLWLSGWDAGPHAAITVRHLLDHSSGLPGHARLWEQADGRAPFARALRDIPLERPPGTASVYSDLGFILLGFALEALEGRPLDAQVGAIAAACAAGFLYAVPRERRSLVAPTEFDAWRGRLVQGEVHDENAAALGGVAGHAGLFGSVEDVGAFARLVLRTFRHATDLGTPELMASFSEPSSVPGSSRALGWDTMRPTSSCGRLLSPAAIGHTGFTGTSLWIDPEQDLYIALLANRVHPTRTNDAWLGWRPRIHEAIVRALRDAG